MATTLIRKQLAPSATTLTDIYTVPSATTTVFSALIVTNRSNIATTFRIALRTLGAAISNEMYLYYDIPIPGNETFIANIGLTAIATDVISVYAGAATLSFTVCGQENT